MSTPGTLYVVGTPIGNLGDMTHRAVEVLRSAAVIVCEDTRVTKKLLDHYQISTPTTSVHQHSSAVKIDEIIHRLYQGQDVAVVTDAGMPGIADPGGKLVAAAVEHEIPVVTVPGPSAVTSALSIAGVPADRYLFLGFLPHKKGRETLFKRIASTDETVVLYESPHRLMKTLESLSKIILNRLVVVCRELTKIHESVIRGNAADVLKHYTDHPDQVRGEIVIIIGPHSSSSLKSEKFSLRSNQNS